MSSNLFVGKIHKKTWKIKQKAYNNNYQMWEHLIKDTKVVQGNYKVNSNTQKNIE